MGRNSFRTVIVGGALVLALWGMSGCQQALFPTGPRTQFDHQLRMRGRNVPLTEPDVFGNPQPALRARLSQDQS